MSRNKFSNGEGESRRSTKCARVESSNAIVDDFRSPVITANVLSVDVGISCEQDSGLNTEPEIGGIKSAV